MSERWFIAIPLDESNKDAFARFRKHHTSAFRDVPQLKKVRWIAPEKLHITGLFLGDVEDEKQQAVQEAVQKVAQQTQPFHLHLHTCIFAPESRKPRMIWARFHNNHDFIRFHFSLREQIGHHLTLEEAPKEPIPHVTLARFKPFRNNNQVDLRQTEMPQLALTVEHCEIWSSERHEDGAYYRTVRSFQLGSDK